MAPAAVLRIWTPLGLDPRTACAMPSWGSVTVRSSSKVRNHVLLDRPLRRCQSAGKQLMAACRARVWSCDGTARAMWPNRRSLVDVIREVTGGGPVEVHLTSSLVTWAVFGMRRRRRRHHWSKASRRRLVNLQVLPALLNLQNYRNPTLHCSTWLHDVKQPN